jgi:alpha-aminoadipic semialdehyde synthase
LKPPVRHGITTQKTTTDIFITIRTSNLMSCIWNTNHILIKMKFLSSGFADTIQGLQLLGLLDPDPHPALHPKGPDITWVSSAENVQL